MKSKKLLYLISGLGMSFIFGACTNQKAVVKGASKNLDPLPTAVKKEVPAEDPLVSKQWIFVDLGISQTGAPTVTSRRITVAVLSTGVDYNHEDLRGNILINQSEVQLKNPGDVTPLDGVDDDSNGYVDDLVGWDVIDEDGLPFDKIGLGTAASGVIGALHQNGVGIRGLLPEVSIIPVRYIGENGRTHVPNLVKALNYVNAVNPDVVLIHMANINYGDGATADTKAAVMEAERSGLRAQIEVLKKKTIHFVITAGNSGQDLKTGNSVLRDLSQMPNALVVTSIDQNKKRPFIANYGMELVDLAAPGVSILTTKPGNEYGEESGTLMAGAHVAGAVALALNKYYSKFSPRELYDKLLSETSSVDSLQFETKSGGQLHVGKFLTSLSR